MKESPQETGISKFITSTISALEIITKNEWVEDIDFELWFLQTTLRKKFCFIPDKVIKQITTSSYHELLMIFESQSMTPNQIKETLSSILVKGINEFNNNVARYYS